MSDSIRFNDPVLDDVVRRHEQQFSNFQKTLDQTSTDIKNLEKWLQNCGVCAYSSVRVENSDIPSLDLAWSNSKKEWRIVCERPAEDAHFADELDVTPLMEMPVRIRLLCRSHLPALVQQLADLLPPDIPTTKKSKTELQDRLEKLIG